MSNASATTVNIIFSSRKGKENTELKLINIIMQWQSERIIEIESTDYSLWVESLYSL